MKQQRFVPFPALAGVVVAVLVTVVVACGQGDGGSSAGALTTPSGEEIFRGLVFREGAVAALFPELRSRGVPREPTPAQREARERARAKAVADIRQAEPAFFERFGAEMRSGDHLRIEQALRESAELLRRVTPKRVRAASEPDGSDEVILANTADAADTAFPCTDYCPGTIIFIDVDTSIDASFDVDVDVDVDNDDESGWRGTRLGREQLTELIAARLVAG